MMPSVLNQLGPDAMAVLQRIAEQYKQSGGAQGPGGIEGDAQEADDEVPELVEADPAVRCLSSSSLLEAPTDPLRFSVASRRRAPSSRTLCVSRLAPPSH